MKPRAFDGFTSACLTDGIGSKEIEAIAEQYVSPGRAPASLKGWAELTVGDVSRVGLSAVHDGVNYDRHVEVSGWPESKDSRLAIEMELAARSRLVLRGDR